VGFDPICVGPTARRYEQPLAAVGIADADLNRLVAERVETDALVRSLRECSNNLMCRRLAGASRER
jgi:hypothetical protein